MPWTSRSLTTISSRVRRHFSLIRRRVQSATPDSLPCPPPLPCFLASSDPVVRFKMTMSFTNLIETRNCAAFAIALGPMARRWLTPVHVTFLNKINDPPTQLHRKWLAHQCPPTSAIDRGDHKAALVGIPNSNGHNVR